MSQPSVPFLSRPSHQFFSFYHHRTYFYYSHVHQSAFSGVLKDRLFYTLPFFNSVSCCEFEKLVDLLISIVVKTLPLKTFCPTSSSSQPLQFSTRLVQFTCYGKSVSSCQPNQTSISFPDIISMLKSLVVGCL